MDAKNWYESKELIVAGVALVSGFLQGVLGEWLVAPEVQGGIAIVVMAALRYFCTSQPIK